MTDWVANGGCINGIRYANDGAGAGARDWAAAADIGATFIDGVSIIVAVSLDSDDMDAISGDVVLDWRNVTDNPSGSWTSLAATGELKWATDTDLVNNNAVVDAERNGTENCTGMGVSHLDGIEREGANDVALSSVASDSVFDLQWAVDLTGADGTNGDVYEFRVSEDGSNSYKIFTARITMTPAGKIDDITKNNARTAAVVSVTVSAYASDGAGSNPKPVGPLVAQVVSSGSDGTYSLQGGLESGEDYFLHFYKDDTADLSDGSPVVTAVAR